MSWNQIHDLDLGLRHWRKINGFGNNYFGWGGEALCETANMKVAFAILCPCDVAQDDELHHRLRLNGLLYGDCFMALNFGHTKQCRTSLAFVANSSEPGINHLGYVAFWFGNLQATRALGVHRCFSLALRMRLSTLRKERPHHGEAGPVHQTS